MSLSTARKISQMAAIACLVLPVTAGAQIYQGGLVIMDGAAARAARTGQGGNDVAKAQDAAKYRVMGVAQATVLGGVADGDVTVEVKPGAFNFKNSAGADEITDADIGKIVFVVDDETVARTPAGGTRCAAGVVLDIDDLGVWVDVGPNAVPRQTVILPFAINETDTLAGTSAELVSPVKGAISRMVVTVQKAVTTGGDVTAAVGVTAVDGLACAIADGAAKGTIVQDRPTAGHASTAVLPGDRIQVVPAAAFATAGAVSGFIEIAL